MALILCFYGTERGSTVQPVFGLEDKLQIQFDIVRHKIKNMLKNVFSALLQCNKNTTLEII